MTKKGNEDRKEDIPVESRETLLVLVNWGGGEFKLEMGGAHILPQLFPTQAEHLIDQEKGVFNPDSNDVLLSADGRSLYLIPTIFMT